MTKFDFPLHFLDRLMHSFPMFQCSNVQMFNVQMFKCSNIQMSQCSNVQVLKCSNAQMLKCSNVQMSKCSNVKYQIQMSISWPKLSKMLLTQSSTSSADPVCRQVSTALVLTEMKKKNVVSCFELNPTQDRASTYEKVAAHCLRIGKGSFLRFCLSTHHPLLLTKPNQCEYTSQLPLEEEKDFRIIFRSARTS